MPRKPKPMTKTRKRPFQSNRRKPPWKRIPARLRAKGIKGNMELEGTLDLIAASGDKDAEPKLTLYANTGKPMNLAGFEHPVIVDMKGARFDKKTTPIIADHKTTNRVGHTTQQLILVAGQKGRLGDTPVVGPFIGAVGIRSSEMEIAKGIVKDAKAGFPFQVSIGATIREGYVLAEDEEADINGKMWHGPLIVAKKSVIRELSVTALGADNDTTTIVATKEKENDMEFEAWVESLGLDLAAQSEDTVTALKATHTSLYPEDDDTPPKKKGKKKIKAKVKAGADDPDEDEDDDDGESRSRKRKRSFTAGEEEFDIEAYNERLGDNEVRVNAIKATAEEFDGEIDEEITIKAGRKEIKMSLGEYKVYAIKKNIPAHEFELTCRRMARPEMRQPAIHMIDKGFDSKAVEASILRDSGCMDSVKNPVTGREYGLDQWYDDKVMEASWDKRYRMNNSISKLMSLQCRAAGMNISHIDKTEILATACNAWNKMGGKEIKALAGASGLSITNIIENVMHKSALASFEAVETVWRAIAGTMSVNDFRTHNMYRLDFNGHFRKVPTDGELKHIGVTDSKYTIGIDTYGAMIAIDRKTQIDDDMDMVLAKARGIGSLGAQRIEELVFVTLLGNAGSFFAAGNNNLITGGGSALSIAGLAAAELVFANQVINDKPITVGARTLLVGTNNIVTANNLFTQDTFRTTPVAGTPEFQNNPYAGRYRPVVSGYLNNTAIKDQDGNAITGQSSTQWFLFPNPNLPQGSALKVAFLNGRQTPFFDEAETQFNVPGGLQMRCYFDFGSAFNVTQLALKSAGT